MNWYVLNRDYVRYLRDFDSKVGYIDYGQRLKLYFGTVLTADKFLYYLPVSSAKDKHRNMKNSIFFQKVEDEKNLYAVLNLNNMIPVPDSCVQQLKYDQIDNFREFESDKQRTDYVYLLQKEKRIVDGMENVIADKALNLYLKYKENPKSKLAEICCDFPLLEEKSLLWSK